MKISFFIGGLSGGGAERVVCNLSNFLVAHNHEVSIVTMADDEPSYLIDERIKRIILIKKNERKNIVLDSITRLYRLRKLLKNNSCDVYVVMLPITIILLLLLRKNTSAKVIASERSNPNYNKPLEKLFLRFLARRADGWVFQTDDNKKWYEQYLSYTKTAILPNAIEGSFSNYRKNDEGREKVIVAVGRLAVPKNHHLLVKAFALIHNSYPEYKVVFYGEGPDKKSLQQLSQKLGVEDSVLFPGYSKNVAEKIRQSSIFVFTSDWEGMPNALIEAMGLGLPCISTDFEGGGARFLIENEKNGLLVPKGDVQALSVAIQRFLSDRDFAVSCGLEAHKICDRLAPDIIYKGWESFIEEITMSVNC